MLIEDGFIAESTFTNIVMLGIHVREFDWASDFIQSYAAQLPVNYRTSLEAYSRGRLFYAMGHYKKAMRQLAQVSARLLSCIWVLKSYKSKPPMNPEQLTLRSNC